MKDKLRLILGTMTFGSEADEKESYGMLQLFSNSGFNEIDTASVYNKGETETILGSVFKKLNTFDFSVATKVHPRVSSRLDGEAVKEQFEKSLKRMERDTIDILYFHLPDSQTPVEEPLEVMAELFHQGKIKEFGLSNFPVWMVVDIWHLCEKNGWPLPTVYQGMYNAFSRNIEAELLPVLRKFGIRFYAYNPLAGGILTGKYTHYNNLPTQGRFFRSQVYKERYWKKSYFEALKNIMAKCYNFNIEPSESAYRWLAFHSSLRQQDGDGIIIGASNLNQLDKNLLVLEKGILPEPIVNEYNIAWEIVKKDSPDYFNFFS